MKKFCVVIMTFLLIITISACSSNSSKDEKGKDGADKKKKIVKEVKPQDLISKEEAESLTGLSVTDTETLRQDAVNQELITYSVGTDGLLQISVHHMSRTNIVNNYNDSKKIYSQTVDIENLGKRRSKRSNWAIGYMCFKGIIC